jgi:hypothetical protein
MRRVAVEMRGGVAPGGAKRIGVVRKAINMFLLRRRLRRRAAFVWRAAFVVVAVTKRKRAAVLQGRVDLFPFHWSHRLIEETIHRLHQ